MAEPDKEHDSDRRHLGAWRAQSIKKALWRIGIAGVALVFGLLLGRDNQILALVFTGVILLSGFGAVLNLWSAIFPPSPPKDPKTAAEQFLENVLPADMANPENVANEPDWFPAFICLSPSARAEFKDDLDVFAKHWKESRVKIVDSIKEWTQQSGVGCVSYQGVEAQQKASSSGTMMRVTSLWRLDKFPCSSSFSEDLGVAEVTLDLPITSEEGAARVDNGLWTGVVRVRR